MSVRQDIAAALKGLRSRRNEGNGQIYERFNCWHVTDEELSEIAPLLGDTEFHELFYAVDTETYLRWSNLGNCFKDIENNECYFITIMHEEFTNPLGTGGWNFANSLTGPNHWGIWNNVTVDGYQYALYVSPNAGVFNIYASGGGTQGISHAYKDIDVPAGSQVRVKMLMRSNGAQGNIDETRIFCYNAPFVPTPDVNNATTAEYANMTGVIAHEWIEFLLPASFTGGIMTLVNQWKNNNPSSFDPPGHIQEIIVQYRP